MDQTRTPGYRAVSAILREAPRRRYSWLFLTHYKSLFRLPPEIASLVWLKRLSLNSSPVEDLSPIAGLDLERLDLDKTQVSDLSPLARMTNLQDAAASKYSDHDSGLSYARTPVSRSYPFSRLVLLPQPARTVETINLVRRQLGLAEHIPHGYERPTNIDEILGDLAEKSANPPTIPKTEPAALEPVFSNGRISLPIDPAAADLAEDTRDAALVALKSDLEELATDVEGEANIDRRAAKLLRDVAVMMPEVGPRQDILFRLAHREEVLAAYALTVSREWPEVLASRYHVVCRQFDRTMRQFPKWREFRRNAAKDRFTPRQLAEAEPIARDAVNALAGDDARPFVDPNVPTALKDLAGALSTPRNAPLADIIEVGKELLVEDVVESINNILKRIAELALAAGMVGKEALKQYGRGLAKGLVDAAKKQGSKDGAAVLKWARRFLVGGGGAAVAVALVQHLIRTFPEKFAWLEAVIRFLAL